MPGTPELTPEMIEQIEHFLSVGYLWGITAKLINYLFDVRFSSTQLQRAYKAVKKKSSEAAPAE